MLMSIKDARDRVLGTLDIKGSTWIATEEGFTNVEPFKVPITAEGKPTQVLIGGSAAGPLQIGSAVRPGDFVYLTPGKADVMLE